MSVVNNFIHWSFRLRSRFGNFKLQKELKGLKREHRFLNLKDAKRIGILFDGSEEGLLKEIDYFIKSFEKNNKNITALGYWDKKEIKDNPIRKFGYDYFTRSDVNWFLIPNHTIVKEFIYSDFDILINVNTENSFPLQYVAAMSKATMRVGKYFADSSHYYDLMIYQKSPTNNLKNYFEQVNHYLNIINGK